MIIKNKHALLIYRGFLVLLAIYGILATAGVFKGSLSPVVFVFYTVQSNALVALLFFYLFIRGALQFSKGGYTPSAALLRVKGAVTLCITVTFLIFWALLAPNFFQMTEGDNYLLSFNNNVVHTIVPLMTILDWVLFDEKGVFKKYDPLLWLITPVVYFLFAVIRAEIGGLIEAVNSRYPYFFIDFDIYGYKVFYYVLAIILFFTTLGYLILLIDRKCFKKYKGSLR